MTLELLYDRWGINLEEMGWFSSDMHHHSLHSDGINTIFENKVAALVNDLDFIAATDHNQTTQNEQWLELVDENFVPLPGSDDVLTIVT